MAIRLNITVSLLALLILLWASNGVGTAIAADNNATSTNGTSTEPPANPEEEPDNATLTAIIHVNNENGTNVKASDFRFYVDGVNPSPQTFTGSESPGTTITLQQGDYKVRIVGAPDVIYLPDDDACAGSISNSETKSCTLDIRIVPQCPPGYHFNEQKTECKTNSGSNEGTADAGNATVVITMHTTNEYGGAKQSSDVTVHLENNDLPLITFPGSETGANMTVGAGYYSVSEELPAGYQTMAQGQCSGHISAGETKYCVILNADIEQQQEPPTTVSHDDAQQETSDDVCPAGTGPVSSDEATPDAPLFVKSWGNYGSEDGQFVYPTAVAVDSVSGYVYVVDSQNYRVEKFTEDGKFITKFDESTSPEVTRPTGVAVDPDSQDVYIADSAGQILKFDSEGSFLAKWGSPGSHDGQFRGQLNIAIDPATNNVYVADGGNARVQEFTSDGKFITKWGSSGTADCQFKSMYGISIANSSHGTVVYVADTGLVGVLDSRIQAFTDDGEFIAKWESNGDSDGKFHLLGSISVDPSTGYVYAADSGNNRIQVFSSDGTYLMQWGNVDEESSLKSPFGVAVDPGSHKIFVADALNHRIVTFAPPSSKVVDDIAPDNSQAASAATLPTADMSNATAPVAQTSDVAKNNTSIALPQPLAPDFSTSKPTLHAGSGAVNAGLSLGRSVGISANLTNNAGSPQPFYYVVQVLDVDSGGTVISLSWVSGVLPGGQSVSAGIDWNPTKAGQYRAETFVLDDIDRPTPLSQKQSITFTVSNN